MTRREETARADKAEAEVGGLRAEIAGMRDELAMLIKQRDAAERDLSTLREAEATRLARLARWIRTPGNISLDDAIDECARLLENNAAALSAPKVKGLPQDKTEGLVTR